MLPFPRHWLLLLKTKAEQQRGLLRIIDFPLVLRHLSSPFQTGRPILRFRFMGTKSFFGRRVDGAVKFGFPHGVGPVAMRKELEAAQVRERRRVALDRAAVARELDDLEQRARLRYLHAQLLDVRGLDVRHVDHAHQRL